MISALMKTFLYLFGGMLIMGALLIVAQSPRDPVVWAIASVFAVCGIASCCLNRG